MLIKAFIAFYLVVQVDGLTAQASTEEQQCTEKSKPIAKAMIEYSAAGEYIETVYDYHQYFGGDQLLEDIYNGRDGVINGQPANLDSNGFELVASPSIGVNDWTDTDELVEKYLPTLASLLKERIDSLEEVIFWHPMYRSVFS